MICSVVISFLLAVAYIAIAIWREKELPDSISALVYALPNKWQWTWMVWMLAVSVTTMIPVIDALSVKDAEIIGFVAFASLVFVSVMPLTFGKTMHYPLAVLAGLSSQLCVALICPWWLCLWVIMAALVMAAFAGFNDSEKVSVILGGKGVFMAEEICYVNVIGSLVTYYLQQS